MANVPKFEPRLTQQSATDLEALSRKVDENLLKLRQALGAHADTINRTTYLIDTGQVGGGMGFPLNPVAIFLKATGDDTKNGTSWDTAVRTDTVALARIQAAGGGELHVLDGATCNIRLRGDGIVLPGWFTDFPLRVFGYGKSHWSFGGPAAKLVGGSSTDNVSAQIWLAATFEPKEFYNIAPQQFINQFIRCWDYRRDAAGNIQTCNVTSWTRPGTGTSSAVTLALPPAYNVDSVSRPNGSGVVTLTFTLPRRNMAKMRIGQTIRIASTDPHFDSGDFVIASTPLLGTSVTITYNQTTTAGGPFSGAAGVTIQFSDVGVGDRIHFVTSQPLNVPTTPFLVTAIANSGTIHADQITVFDPYGGLPAGDPTGSFTIGNYAASGTFTNPGTWGLQDRNSYNFSTVDFYGIQGFAKGSPQYDSGMAGPFIDIGGVNDGRIRFFGGAPGVYTPVHGCPDPDRTCFALCDPGANGAVGGQWFHMRPAGTGLRYYGSRDLTDNLNIVDMQADVAFGVPVAPPVVEVINGGSMTVNIDGVFCADRQASDPTPDVRIDSCSPHSKVDAATTVEGPVCIRGNSGSLTQSAWARGQTGTWTSGNKATYAGDMPHQRRLLPLAMARFTNLATTPASWINVTTLTTGVTDNWGRNSAVRVQASIDAYVLQSAAIAIAAGEWVVFGGWARKAAGFASSVFNVRLYFVAGGFADYSIVPFKGDGEWQPLVSRVQATAAVSAVDFSIAPGASSGAGVELSGVFFEHATSVSTNEAAEYAGTIGNRTLYLPPGTAGTLDGVPFVAHGGIGVDSTVLLAPAGAAGLPTKNLPLGDKGMTFQGYVPVLPLNSPLPGDFVASGASHAHGYVPDPGAVAGTAKFLREDAQWAVPPTSGITQLTGDVTAGPGTGSQAATVNWKPFANLNYEWFIGPVTPFPSPAGFLSTASESNYAAGGMEYELGVAAVSIRFSVNVSANSLTGGTGSWDLTVYRNGSATSATFHFTSGVTGKQAAVVIVAGGATTDTYSLYWQANGVGTGGSIGFTACILVNGG